MKLDRLRNLLKIENRKLKIIAAILAVIIISTGIYIFANRDVGFKRGVLVLNLSKSIYVPNETILFQIATLDKHGATLCNSRLKLEIFVPGQKKPVTPQVVPTSTCSPDNNVTNEPDYITRFIPTKSGEYKIKLTNLDTRKKITSSFEVNEAQPELVIERSGATRINPSKSDRYPMSIIVTANKDFSGEIVETVPADFNIIWQGEAVVATPSQPPPKLGGGGPQTEGGSETTTLTWQVSLKSGESKILSYDYQAPQKSPAIIELGPVKIGNSTTISPLESRGVAEGRGDIETHPWLITISD